MNEKKKTLMTEMMDAETDKKELMTEEETN